MDAVENVTQAIQSASEVLNREECQLNFDILDGYMKKAQQDSVFRCDYLSMQF